MLNRTWGGFRRALQAAYPESKFEKYRRGNVLPLVSCQSFFL